MSTKYHISSTTQRPNICRAQSPESCPLKSDDGTPPPHFETKEEARAYVEKSNAEKYGDVPAASSTSRINKDSRSSGRAKIIEKLKKNGYKVSEDKKTINYHGLTGENFDMKISYSNNGDLKAVMRNKNTSEGVRQIEAVVRKEVKLDDRGKEVKDKNGSTVFENVIEYGIISEPKSKTLTREEAIEHLHMSEEFNEEIESFQRKINTAVVSNHAVFGENENRPEELEIKDYDKESFLENENKNFNAEGEIQGDKGSNIFTHYEDNLYFDKGRFPVVVEKRPIERSYNNYSYSSKIDASSDFDGFNTSTYEEFRESLLKYENAIMETNDLLEKAERADYLQPGNSRYLSTYA